MPRLPDYLAREALPATGGVPRGTVAIPVVPQPTEDVQAGTLLTRGLESFGSALTQGAEAVVRSEVLAGQRQRAQDTLDAHTSTQRTDQAFITQWDTLQRGPYQTLPEDVEQAFRTVMKENGGTLTPPARALYTNLVEEKITQWKLKAESLRTARQNQDTIFAWTQALTDAQQKYLSATTEMERQAADAELVTMARDFVQTGLTDGKEAAQMLKGAHDARIKEQAILNIQDAPRASYEDLGRTTQDILQGQPITSTRFKNVPVEMIPGLREYAFTEMSKTVNFTQTQEHQAKAKLHEAQNAWKDYFIGRMLTNPNISAEELEALGEDINFRQSTTDLGDPGYGIVLTLRQALLEKRRQESLQQVDVPHIKETALSQLFTAKTPQDLEDAEQYILDNKDGLRVSLGPLLLQKRSLAQANSPLHDDVVQGALHELQQAAVPSAAPGEAILEKMVGAVRRRYNEAAQIFLDEMQRLYNDPDEGRHAMRRKALPYERELARTYFGGGDRADALLSDVKAALPPIFQAIKTREDGLFLLNSMRSQWDEAVQSHIYEQLERLPETAPAPAPPRAAPAPIAPSRRTPLLEGLTTPTPAVPTVTQQEQELIRRAHENLPKLAVPPQPPSAGSIPNPQAGQRSQYPAHIVIMPEIMHRPEGQ